MPPSESDIEKYWYNTLTSDDSSLKKGRKLRSFIPSEPRCKLCHAPFHGVGGLLMKLTGRGRQRLNPHLCDYCISVAQKNKLGTEVEMALLFADVRDSTALGESMTPTEFRSLLNRFYREATQILSSTGAVIDKFVGDEVIGLYFPAFTDQKQIQCALNAAKELLIATGYGDNSTPWLPIGVGIHYGKAYYGVVGYDDVEDITALGDPVNLTARLASHAKSGEIIITEETAKKISVDTTGFAAQTIKVKGKKEDVQILTLTV